MLPERRVPTHPGVVLVEDFLKPMGITQVAFARHIKVPLQRVNEIARGRRGITPDTAWRFSQALGTSPEFWVNLQATHDLARTQPRRAVASLARRNPRLARALREGALPRLAAPIKPTKATSETPRT